MKLIIIFFLFVICVSCKNNNSSEDQTSYKRDKTYKKFEQCMTSEFEEVACNNIKRSLSGESIAEYCMRHLPKDSDHKDYVKEKLPDFMKSLKDTIKKCVR